MKSDNNDPRALKAAEQNAIDTKNLLSSLPAHSTHLSFPTLTARIPRQ